MTQTHERLTRILKKYGGRASVDLYSDQVVVSLDLRDMRASSRGQILLPGYHRQTTVKDPSLFMVAIQYLLDELEKDYPETAS